MLLLKIFREEVLRALAVGGETPKRNFLRIVRANRIGIPPFYVSRKWVLLLALHDQLGLNRHGLIKRAAQLKPMNQQRTRNIKTS